MESDNRDNPDKPIKLKQHNRIKYCIGCKEKVEIVMVGNYGYCPNELNKDGQFKRKLFTLESSDKKK